MSKEGGCGGGVDFRFSRDISITHAIHPFTRIYPPLTHISPSHHVSYHEGKEFVARMREKRPGVLSQELKDALGMISSLIPPPWLLHMQREGPPPSYPNLKIPGLNAPIPDG